MRLIDGRMGEDNHYQVVNHQAGKEDIDVAEQPVARPDDAVYGECDREQFQKY